MGPPGEALSFETRGTPAAVIRGLLLAYCEWHDRNMKVRFTDIDYKVYTDAAQRVLEGGSPYERHTYRYSPLVAYLCLPNLLGLPFFGKVVFCFMDIAVAWLIEKGLRGMHRARVQQQHQQQQQGAAAVAEMQQSASSPFTSNREQALPSSSSTDSSSSSKEGDDEYPLHTFVLPCCCWLYNPIVATVSVRGNADALPCLLVLLTVSALRWRAVFLAAILYGLSVHVKLYPVIYGIPMLLFLQQGGAADSVVALPERPGGLLQQAVWALLWVPFAAALLPVRVCVFLLRRMGARQWLFGVASVSVFCLLGCAFYRLYGFPFLFESYLYHATRRDHRHNFSVFFYLLYLDSEAPLKGLSLGLLVPQLVGTLLLGCYFARTHLEAALCLQTMVFVALNKVCTSQYFLWWLCLLPFAVASTDMQPRTLKQTTAALVVFQLANLVWLLFGYQLEFEGKPVYLQLMFSSVLFVATQVGLVGFLSSKIRANDKTAAPSDTSRTKKD
ncbi:hypothetical protein Esti_005662 [Eimeria stiedai]